MLAEIGPHLVEDVGDFVHLADRDAARTLVDHEINRDCGVPGDRLVVVDDQTIDKPYGCVFFY